MSRRWDFIEKYLAAYLSECRAQNPFVKLEQKIPIPPTGKEIEALVSYLINSKVDPVIIGSIAVIKHLHITAEDIKARSFRLTQKVELFVSQFPPNLLSGWQINKNSKVLTSWISPTGGTVDFLKIEDLFSESVESQYVVEKDPESVNMGCPVADMQTLFLIKLNSDQERDLLDLLTLARRKNIPENLDKHLWTSTQRKNLDFIKLWIKGRQTHLS